MKRKQHYKARYEDKYGIEHAVLDSDGMDLKIVLRGIEFSGSSFDSLAGKIDRSLFEYEDFKVPCEEGILINGAFCIEIPLQIIDAKKEMTSMLYIDVKLAKDEMYPVSMQLEIAGEYLTSEMKFSTFEDALIDVQNQLKYGMKIKSCLFCRLSHYNPVGNQLNGSLHCFRNYKEKAGKINSKDLLFDLMEEDNVFEVQEMHKCADFDLIEEGGWYYKNVK